MEIWMKKLAHVKSKLRGRQENKMGQKDIWKDNDWEFSITDEIHQLTDDSQSLVNSKLEKEKVLYLDASQRKWRKTKTKQTLPKATGNGNDYLQKSNYYMDNWHPKGNSES